MEEAAHREGAQFGCSQTAVTAGDQQWANSLDVTIEAFSISAHDKTLFKDSPLQVKGHVYSRSLARSRSRPVCLFLSPSPFFSRKCVVDGVVGSGAKGRVHLL